MQKVNQTGQVLDNTVVGITVGETSLSGLQDPLQLTFAHQQLPHVCQPCPPPPLRCPSLRRWLTLVPPLAGHHPTMHLLGSQQRYGPRRGRVRGWVRVLCPVLTAVALCLSPGRQEAEQQRCVTQPEGKRTVCAFDHLTFFTLLLVTIPLPAASACILATLPAAPWWPLRCLRWLHRDSYSCSQASPGPEAKPCTSSGGQRQLSRADTGWRWPPA